MGNEVLAIQVSMPSLQAFDAHATMLDIRADGGDADLLAEGSPMCGTTWRRMFR